MVSATPCKIGDNEIKVSSNDPTIDSGTYKVSHTSKKSINKEEKSLTAFQLINIAAKYEEGISLNYSDLYIKNIHTNLTKKNSPTSETDTHVYDQKGLSKTNDIIGQDNLFVNKEKATNKIVRGFIV